MEAMYPPREGTESRSTADTVLEGQRCSAASNPLARRAALSVLASSRIKSTRSIVLRAYGGILPPRHMRTYSPLEGGYEGEAGESGSLGKGFGFNKGFAAKYDLGDEVGWGHFGYTCADT
ncbi:hypothetical protein ACJX0J_009914, partial [Zea mays]